MKRKQLTVFLTMLVVYALSAFITYTFFIDDLVAVAGMTIPEMELPPVVYGLANAGIVLAVYGLLGLGAYWFAKKLGLPGIFDEDGNWRRWFFIPMGLGLVCGILLILGDMLFAPFNGFGRLLHPGFPASIFASLSAGIGEEIAFRGFVFGLWAFILNWLFKRFNGRTPALWDKMQITDLTQQVTKLEIPTYFLHGLYDYTCAYPLAKDYFEKLDAPVKGFYTFENSAHSPMFEEPEKVQEILLEDVLMGTKNLADAN